MSTRVERQLHVHTSGSRSKGADRIATGASTPSVFQPIGALAFSRSGGDVGPFVRQGADAGAACSASSLTDHAANGLIPRNNARPGIVRMLNRQWTQSPSLWSVTHRPNLHIRVCKAQVQLSSLRQRPPIVEEDLDRTPIGDPAEDNEPLGEEA
jgi:hypothetical protein